MSKDRIATVEQLPATNGLNAKFQGFVYCAKLEGGRLTEAVRVPARSDKDAYEIAQYWVEAGIIDDSARDGQA
jgi:hypothetical protein